MHGTSISIVLHCAHFYCGLLLLQVKISRLEHRFVSCKCEISYKVTTISRTVASQTSVNRYKFTSLPERGAKYHDHRVCLSVCMFICVSQKP